jgi:hypothetical protein
MAGSFSLGMRSRGVAGPGAGLGGASAAGSEAASLRFAHDSVGNSGVLAGIAGADGGYLFGSLAAELLQDCGPHGARASNTLMQQALRGQIGEVFEDHSIWSSPNQATESAAKMEVQTQAMRLGAFTFSTPAAVNEPRDVTGETAPAVKAA